MGGLVPRRVRWAVVLAMVWAPMGVARAADLPPEWEIRENLASLVSGTERLKPLLEAAKPDQWTQKGAAEPYRAQWQSVTAEVGYVGQAAGELQRQPERLTLALETYFRMQSLNSMLSSLNEGIRKYHNPALADLISGSMNANAAPCEKLRQFIVQLAAAKEEQFKVMDQEAQRCRVMLFRQPSAKNGPDKRTESK